MAIRTTKSGGIYIEIGGDYSQLQADLKQVNALARSEAKGISDAFSGALKPTEIARNATNLTKYLATAQRAAQGMKAELSGSEQKFREMGRAIGVAEKDLGRFVSMQKQMFQAQNQKSFTDNLKGIQRLTGSTDKEMNALAKSMGGVGNEFTKAAQGVNVFGMGLGKLAVAGGVTLLLNELRKAVAESFQLATRYETLGVVVRQVGQVNGYSAIEIDKNVNAIRRMGIAGVEARKSLTQLVQAQVDITKTPALARIAQDAAVIGGVNSSEAFEKLVHGIQSAQTEVLRTIGINVNFEQSYRAMAASLGKITSELTEQEKMQARVNAVMGAGEKIAGSYEAAMGTLGKQINSMSRILQDAGTDAGKLLVDLVNATGATKFFSESIEGLNASVLWLRGEMAGLNMDDMLNISRSQGLAGLREYVEGAEQAVEETQRFEIQLAALANKLSTVDAGLLKNELATLKTQFDDGALSVEQYRRSIADLMVMARAGVGVIGDDLTGAQKIIDDLRTAYGKTAAGGKEAKMAEAQGNLQQAMALKASLGADADKMIAAFKGELDKLDGKTKAAGKSAGAAIERTSFQAAQAYKDALNGLTNLTMRTAELRANLQGETLQASFEKINRQFDTQVTRINEARAKMEQDAKTWAKGGKLDAEAQNNLKLAMEQLDLQERELAIQKELERELARRAQLEKDARAAGDYAGLIGDLKGVYEAEVAILQVKNLSASATERMANEERIRIATARATLNEAGMIQTGLAEQARDAAQRIVDYWEKTVPESIGTASDSIGTLFGDIMTGSKSAAEAFSDMGKTMQNIAAQLITDMINMTLRMMLFGQATQSVMGAAGNVGGIASGIAGGGGGGGLLGNIFGAIGGFLGFAKGGAIASPSLSAFSNTVVDTPKLFAFAKGGSVGLMGEAGAEAIMPLTRTSTGDLGVAVDLGGNRSGGGDVYFQMNMPAINIEYTSQPGSTPEMDGQKMAETLGAQLRTEMTAFVKQTLITESRPGGLMNPGIGV